MVKERHEQCTESPECVVCSADCLLYRAFCLFNIFIPGRRAASASNLRRARTSPHDVRKSYWTIPSLSAERTCIIVTQAFPSRGIDGETAAVLAGERVVRASLSSFSPMAKHLRLVRAPGVQYF